MLEAQKLEGLRPSQSVPQTGHACESPKEYAPSFLLGQLQPEFREPLPHFLLEVVHILSALEIHHESSRPGELHPQALTDSGLERLRSSGSYRPVAARRTKGQWAKSRGSLEAVLLTQCSALCRCRFKRLYFAIAQYAKHWSR